MFSKLMKKTIAVAAAVAMTSVMAASTSPWWSINFDSYAEGKLPETEAQGSWTQNADDLSVISGQKLVLDTQGEDLTWTPTPVAENYDSVILDADVKFVASDVEPNTTEDMQTAIYLKALEDGSTELCAYQTIEGAQVWDALEGFKIADGDTKHVNITIKYNDESGKPIVTVTIDDKSASYVAANTEKKVVTSVSFRGTGTIDNFKADTGIDVTYVASVGDKQFETYAEAFAWVAANGGDLTLFGDSDETSFGELTFNSDATIDLNGKTIEASFVVDGGAQLTIDNGTVNAPMGYDVVYIKNGKATVGAGAVLNASDNCVVFMKNTTNANAQLALDVHGKLYATEAGYAAIQGNGLNKAASEIYIADNAVVSHEADLAIYHPQVGTLTIDAATITGTTGIEMRAGDLVVDGATITANGDFDATANGNGSTVLGAAIALSQHTTEKPTTVTVNGGTLAGEYAFYQTNLADGTSESVAATIAGTTIEGAVATAEKGFVMPEAEDGSYTLATADFIVAGMPYDTFADAYAAAAEDATIEVYTDFSATEIITIAKGITIEGNGHTLTSTASRAINIDTTGAVVINDLTINAGERAVNIINQASTVTLNNVTASAKNNAVMIATSAGAANVTINDSDLTGLAVVNVAGAGATVAINDTNITNVDANEKEDYGAISTYKTATGATVTVNGGKVVVAGDSFAGFNAIAGSSIVFNGTEGVDRVVTPVAYIGDAGYETLEEAIDAAKAGQTITLNADITASEIITINKDITFDGNGHTLTSTAPRAINVDGANGATIQNLTIVANGERGINIIGGATNVTITDVDVTAKNYAVNLAASAEGAVVTITDSTLTGLNAFNAGAANAEITITGSEIYCNDNSSSEYYGAISLNQDAAGTQVVVTGSQFHIKDDSVVAVNGASGKGATITIDGSSEAVTSVVAAIDEANGYNTLFTTLAGAFEEAEAGETVKLIANATEDVTIAATATLDLNGFAATGTFTITDAAAKLYAADGLTVASGVANYVVVYADGYYYVEEQVVEFAPVAVTAIAINGDTAELTIAGDYTEVKVFFCENLGDEWVEVSAIFANGVATVPATTATGFFKVEAR
ncbi:MAG: hypothetical protein J6V41_01870 [Kiritimatiellae bacterium]|nr:hypothetical protein [Kiritimatiellia bacterium]